VQAFNTPRILKVRGENMVMVMPVGTVQQASPSHKELWGTYDPQRVQQALHQSTNILEGVDKNLLLEDIAQQREQTNHNRS
jgi:hypothetical protein